MENSDFSFNGYSVDRGCLLITPDNGFRTIVEVSVSKRGVVFNLTVEYPTPLDPEAFRFHYLEASEPLLIMEYGDKLEAKGYQIVFRGEVDKRASRGVYPEGFKYTTDGGVYEIVDIIGHCRAGTKFSNKRGVYLARSIDPARGSLPCNNTFAITTHDIAVNNWSPSRSR